LNARDHGVELTDTGRREARVVSEREVEGVEVDRPQLVDRIRAERRTDPLVEQLAVIP